MQNLICHNYYLANVPNTRLLKSCDTIMYVNNQKPRSYIGHTIDVYMPKQ